MVTILLPRQDRIPRNAQEAKERATGSCSAWNQYYPAGSRVRVYRMLGDESSAIDSTTTSQAWVMGGHSARVMIQGLSGGHCLTHVKPHCGSAKRPLGELATALIVPQETAAAIADQLESGVGV
jgi:hypothetical protein